MENIQTKALKKLREFYDFCSQDGNWNFYYSQDELRALSRNERDELFFICDYLKEKGWLKTYAPTLGTPLSYSFTSAGIDQIETIHSPSVPNSVVINVEKNSGIVANTASHNIINNSIDFDSLEVLIRQHLSNQNEINEILSSLHNLQNQMNTSQPIEQGILSKINDKIKNYAWLASPVAALLLQYATASPR